MWIHLVMLAVVVGGAYWLFALLLANPGIATITWGTWGLEMKTATLLVATIVVFLLMHFALNLLLSLLTWRKHYQKSRDNKALARGLMQLTEGNWAKAEKLLLFNAKSSKSPSISYLSAARAAHMQNDFGRRDEWLQLASQKDKKAQLAVGVSQAEMQSSSGQLEQARATLDTLRSQAPRHPYVLKLYAQVLHQQESWSELLDLLPDLLRYRVLKTDDLRKAQADSLSGLFRQESERGGTAQLQLTWKRLPALVREQDVAIYLYALKLHELSDDTTCAQFIQANLNKHWNDQLAGLYGQLEHASITHVVQHAERWREAQQNNPAMLLMMARLYRQQKLWGVAKNYYEASLGQAPDAAAYLELAELLTGMGEVENAQRCYEVGLRYSIRNKSERLNLAPTKPRSAAMA